MKLQYTDATGYKTIIDLTKSREQYWIDNAPDIYGKRSKWKNADYGAFTIGEYHAVRNILEDMKPTEFNQVVERFIELYPNIHSDWQSALRIGLLHVAQDREHTKAPYYYNDTLTIQIREEGLNKFNFDSLIIQPTI